MRYQRTVSDQIPKTFVKALCEGYSISEEHFEEDVSLSEKSSDSQLVRTGHFLLERIDKKTGDRELLKVLFSADIEADPPQDYKVDRHVYLTPQEAKSFGKRARRK